MTPGPWSPAGTGFRQFQDSEVRYRPEALQALSLEKDKILESAFPLLAQGDGNGNTGAQQPAAGGKSSNALESLLGGGKE